MMGTMARSLSLLCVGFVLSANILDDPIHCPVQVAYAIEIFNLQSLDAYVHGYGVVDPKAINSGKA
jgi:hypothetical protein